MYIFTFPPANLQVQHVTNDIVYGPVSHLYSWFQCNCKQIKSTTWRSVTNNKFIRVGRLLCFKVTQTLQDLQLEENKSVTVASSHQHQALCWLFSHHSMSPRVLLLTTLFRGWRDERAPSSQSWHSSECDHSLCFLTHTHTHTETSV